MACAFVAETAKPTRFITNITDLVPGAVGGWPSFDANGEYTGPLPLSCGCRCSCRAVAVIVLVVVAVLGAVSSPLPL